MVRSIPRAEPPDRRTLPRYGTVAAILVAAALLAYWLTRPPDRLVLDSACDPEEIPSRFSAWIYGPEFWKKQQAAIAEEIGALQELRDRAKDGTLRSFDMTPIERRMRRLSDKEMADIAAGNEQAWREQIIMLGRCNTVVTNILAGRTR